MNNIAFITDLHIDESTSFTKDVNTRTHFIKILDKVVKSSPDMIILGGDLCNREGDADIYDWVKERMDESGIPYHVIPGNHDDGKMMAKIFYDEDREECYRIVSLTDKTTIILLDSSKGCLSYEQWSWLGQRVGEGNTFICMHHPPMLIGSKHMEPKYGFEQEETFMQLMAQSDANIYVISGHYHTELSQSRDNVHMFITPSTFLQINHDSVELDMIKDQIGYRLIRIDNRTFKTSVVYL